MGYLSGGQRNMIEHPGQRAGRACRITAQEVV
jgi:hypothetical protein